jgi:hypothetical protein
MHLSKNNNRDYGFEQSSLYCKKIVMQRIRKGRWNIVEEGFVSKPFMCAEMKKTPQLSLRGFLFGGESGIRTPDLRIMIPSL